MTTKQTAGHTPGPWAHTDWATTGPSAAAALVGESAMSDYNLPFCRVAQACSVGRNAVAVAVGDSRGEAEANAARIVACVNACEGVSTDDLTAIPNFVACNIANGEALANEADHCEALADDLRAERDALKAQNEELAGALRFADPELRLFMDAEAVCDHSVNICWCTYNRMREQMRSALSRLNDKGEGL